MVFPLGMYAAATAMYAQVTGYDFLLQIPRLFVWFAFAAWLAAVLGFVVRCAGAAIKR